MGQGAPERMLPGGGDPVANGRKGGIASGIVRNKKKSLQESLQGLLYAELSKSQKKQYQAMGYKIPKGQTVTFLDLAGARCLAKVIAKGDIKGFAGMAQMAGLVIEDPIITLPSDRPGEMDPNNLDSHGVNPNARTIVNVSVKVEDDKPTE